MIKLTKENTEKLKMELLKLKLQEIHSVEDKMRIQSIQQILDIIER
jgi:hypothetical protein